MTYLFSLQYCYLYCLPHLSWYCYPLCSLSHAVPHARMDARTHAHTLHSHADRHRNFWQCSAVPTPTFITYSLHEPSWALYYPLPPQPVWEAPKSTSTPTKDSKASRGQKFQDALKRDVPLKLIGQFGSQAHYLKLLEGVRSSYTNYQLNLDFEGSDKFSLLLGNALNCLAALLEVSTFQDVAKVCVCVRACACVCACACACVCCICVHVLYKWVWHCGVGLGELCWHNFEHNRGVQV